MNSEVRWIVIGTADHPRLARIVSSTSGVVGYQNEGSLLIEIDPIPGLYCTLVTRVGVERHHHALATINGAQLLSKSLHGNDEFLIPSKHRHVDKNIVCAIFIRNFISVAWYTDGAAAYLVASSIPYAQNLIISKNLLQTSA